MVILPNRPRIELRDLIAFISRCSRFSFSCLCLIAFAEAFQPLAAGFSIQHQPLQACTKLIHLFAPAFQFVHPLGQIVLMG
jgi:hypothetical protein